MSAPSTPSSALARLSIEKPVLTWMVILFCLLGGLSGFINVGRLEDPAFTIKEAIIFTPYPGATAEEVEQEVTEALEIAIQQMGEVDEIRSESAPGLSEIHVTVDDTIDSADMPAVWTRLRARVRDTVASLPPGAGAPVVYDDFGDTYGIFYAVTAEGYSDARIRDIARTLRRELLTVENVAKVAVEGEPDERIYIEIPQENLARLGLPFADLLENLERENAVVTAGSTPMDGRLVRVEIPQTLGGIDAVSNLLITPRGSDQAIRLSDIAEVRRQPVERPSQFIYHNNARAFTIGVAGLPTANIVDVGHAVETRLAELEASLPLGVELHPIYQQHLVVDDAINNFLVSLALSIAIVIGVLCLFMGWRAGLTVGAVLFLTVSGTIFFMDIFALEMERISLGALIIAMGMLVDNAIVVTEGMLTGVMRGRPRMQAAEEAVASTQWPLLGATVIGILAFAGIGLSPDATGEFLFSLFAVIAISLLLSWVIAVTVVPMIGYHLFAAQRAAAQAAGDAALDSDSLYSGRLFKGYRGLLSLALSRRWIVLAGLIAVTLICYVGFGSVRNSFFPATNTPMFYVNVELPEGTDILATDATLREIGGFIAAQPETEVIDTFVGAGATRFMLTYSAEQPNAAYGQVIVRTRDINAIPALADRILAHVRETLPDVDIRADRIIFGPPSGAKLEARFSGPDADMLRALAEEATSALSRDGDVIDIRTDWRNRTPVLRPLIVEERAQTIGVTRENIANALRFATVGSQVGVYREGETLIPILARAPEAERSDPDYLDDRLVWSPQQAAYVPINQVVSSFALEFEDVLIQRRDRTRTLSVRANPHPWETASEGFARFAPIIETIDLPPGYSMEWGGEHEASAEANASLGRQLPLTFIAMLTISFLLFAKIRQPLIIWAVVPMSVNGVVIGLLATNVAFSFTALLGLLSLSGMLIKNAIVLVDEIDMRIRSGADRAEAVSDGSVSRLRPVLLAAATTILGMTPLLTDAFFQGMAVTIIGGLTFATVLTMIAVPVLYALFFGIRPQPAIEDPVRT
ncbi:efflux RND transporter permease subunit [Maricaulis sp.]|uniref:efflux RND transporter permease subunit n=1 Tax=Maricaulis sp. TaxID=1486257 RepID=UPI0025BF06DA|nr:efflux RND transporter permease subunit [Maricaulis sp.]